MRTLRVLLAIIALVGAGCEAPVTTSELVMDDFSYRPTTINLPADTEGFELTLTNKGTVPHDFTVDGLPDDILVDLAVFEGASLPYPLPALPAGEYEVYCALEGHREAGMEATLRVS
ncbi:cupredoxin domain-containing protein [Euzebya rosea]|uniref:cupredoxin domain-containing protein n=1 Tax=Euzebya rosea TaxID=2052804 RepID=UPI000D3E1093|nr:cupredoxin domain-containing protein [Euzebya rosea]